MIILITGGARSGKTRFALERAADTAPRAYIATAELLDEEMRERARLHRLERGERWITIEEPLDVAGCLAARRGVVVIDCLTLWLSNWMLKHPRLVDAKIQELTEAAAGTDADVIAVTNEVGSSIVPDSALGRSFRDAAGRMNQTFARLADSVYLMVCGIPLQVK